MKIKNPFAAWTRFEWWLWGISMIVTGLSYSFSPERSMLSFVATLIGVTALIFLAKGHVLGQLLILVFSVLYGIISLKFRYYGELITYMGMTAPMAALAAIQWLKNPYQGSSEVRVARLTRRAIAWLSVISVIVTVAFYFILDALGNENLLFSTLSVATSFVAAALAALRSSCCSLGYACNDVVLIVLWVMASVEDISYLSMVICFVVFLVNDAYGFINWRRMERRQCERREIQT
jgi:nicotinamide mononucleotide transporter PnuC